MNMDYPELPTAHGLLDSLQVGYTRSQMRAYVDADRAQRAAPGVQGGEPAKWVINPHDMEQGYMLNPVWLSLHGLTAKEARAQRTPPAQPPQQSAHPSMQDALAAGDGTLFFVDPEIIRWTLAGSPRAKTQLWLAKTARPEDGLTMPLYAVVQPVEVQRVAMTDAEANCMASTSAEGGLTIACNLLATVHKATSVGESLAAVVAYRKAERLAAIRETESAHGILSASSEGGV